MSPARPALDTIDLDEHSFEGIEQIPTPTLLVYEKHVEENLDRVIREIESVVPGSGTRHLRPHVKTHKSPWTAGRAIERGVTRFKCTPHELDMLLDLGVPDIFVAYPPLRSLAETLAERAASFPGCRISSQVSCLEHARFLATAATAHDVTLDVFIDLDVGAGRTGLAPDDAPALYRAIREDPALGGLRIAGLHAYDGHNSSPDLAARQECSRTMMGDVVNAIRAIESGGGTVERLAVGGTPGFLSDLDELVHHHSIDADIDVSPGTFVYWDSKYDSLMPGRFRLAALILARVMDRPSTDRATAPRATLDLGHKRWALDQGPVERFSVPNVEVLATTEEHTVLVGPGVAALDIDQQVLIAPRHVCSTVNLWESFRVVRRDGTLAPEAHPVSARNR